MKNKMLIALALSVVLALSLSAFIGCNVSVTKVELKEGTLKTNYIYGETVSFSDAVIIVTMSDGSKQEVALTQSMLTPAINTSVVGTTTHTITYQGATCELSVTVSNPATSLQLKEGTLKTSYEVGEKVDLSQAKVVVTYADSTTREVALTEDMFNAPIDTSAEGTVIYTISYEGQQTTVIISVQQEDVPPVVVTSISVVEGTLKTTYTQGDAVDLSGAKLSVTFSNGTNQEIDLAANMFTTPIDTSVVGKQTYTIQFNNVQTTVDITVEAPLIDVLTFQLPEFYTNYQEVSGAADTSDANFKVGGNVYEVGNANAFLVKPIVTGLDNGEEITISQGLRLLYKVEVAEAADGQYTTLSGDQLEQFVTVEDGVKYFFSADAAGRYVRLTISLDPESYNVEGITSSRTLQFKVVANGYNVYDQTGLSVMNDLTRPEFWADIWGCTVDENNALQAGSQPLILEADTKPLYQYVGNVDWVILHGSITIDPDQLPELYFWDSTRAGYCADNYNTAIAALNSKAPEAVKEIELNGTLIDGNGQNALYSICKDNVDSNFNKGFYNTNKVSVSGNYNSITVSAQRTASGRLLKVLVSRNTANDNDYFQTSQWHIFKMFEPRTASGYVETATEFAIKNVALKGNGGKTEAVGPQGVSMVNSYAKKTTVENVVANGFYTNLSLDNYSGSAGGNIDVVLKDSKMYDTYNAMAITWRGNLSISNCMLKDAGGPLFVLMDGQNRVLAGDGNDKYVPTVTVDQATTMESLAMGTESWYTQLGAVVPQMFAQLQMLDTGLQQISGKSFFTSKNNNNYASVLSIMITDTGSALGSSNFDNYKSTGKFVVGEETSDMLDTKFRQVTDILAAAGQGTVVMKSGSCYAFVWQDTAGGQVIISYEMMMALLQKYSTSGNPADLLVNTSSSEYLQGLQAMALDWRTNSSDTITVWLQAQTGQKTSPYIGAVFGNYHSIEATA